MERAADVPLQPPAVPHLELRVEGHQSLDEEGRQIPGVLQNQAVLRARPDHRVRRPSGCVLDAWGAVHRRTGPVLKDRFVAGRRQVLRADDDRKLACRAVCLHLRRMCPWVPQLPEPEPEPCKPDEGRSAA